MAQDTSDQRLHIDEMTAKTVLATMEALVQSINKDNEERFKPVVDAIEQQFAGRKMNPEDFSLLIGYDILENLHAQLITRFFPQYPNTGRSCRAARFVIEHYSFIENQISSIIVKIHGHRMCCVDCARWLIKQYILFLQDPDFVPDMTIDEKCYWKPDFGSGEEWMAFCQGIEELYYGDYEKFSKARLRLMVSNIKN